MDFIYTVPDKHIINGSELRKVQADGFYVCCKAIVGFAEVINLVNKKRINFVALNWVRIYSERMYTDILHHAWQSEL